MTKPNESSDVKHNPNERGATAAEVAEYAQSLGGADIHGVGAGEEPQAPVFGVWQPIETAPKDGTRILLGYERSHSEEGYWQGDPSRSYWRETGWMAADEDPLTTHPSNPIHWMPLPPAPTGSQ